MLLLAVRKVLLQSILIAMPRFMLPNYWMSKIVINNLNEGFHRFLWGKGNGAHGIPLVAWERIYRSHKEDEFGIQQLDVLQKACLTKHLAKYFWHQLSLN